MLVIERAVVVAQHLQQLSRDREVVGSIPADVKIFQ